jgi:hypothetical protein
MSVLIVDLIQEGAQNKVRLGGPRVGLFKPSLVALDPCYQVSG